MTERIHTIFMPVTCPKCELVRENGYTNENYLSRARTNSVRRYPDMDASIIWVLCEKCKHGYHAVGNCQCGTILYPRKKATFPGMCRTCERSLLNGGNKAQEESITSVLEKAGLLSEMQLLGPVQCKESKGKRNVWCPKYRECLDVACKGYWRGYTCEFCERFGCETEDRAVLQAIIEGRNNEAGVC